MKKERFRFDKEGAWLLSPDNFIPSQIFDCGQTFRFEQSEHDGECFEGVALGRFLRVRAVGDDILLEGVSEEEFFRLWYSYFDLDRDYGALIHSLSDVHARKCADFGNGIRILRQDRWETLCSFIVSQNNNIPRIKKIIDTMCRRFGEELPSGHYAFPTAKALAAAGIDAIFACGTGFRAKYIYDAAVKVASGEISLEKAGELPQPELRELLLTVKGVGPKVAACVELFGFAHCDSFPIDVWIKRVIDKYYGDDFSPEIFGKGAGIVQQYLFYYERNAI